MTRSLLAAYEARRNRECRLTAGRALKTLDEAAGFLAERGLLTRMPDSALPSLFGACHEEPARAGGRGFDLWPRTKWVWSFQLTQNPGTVLTKLHRGKSLFLSLEAARVFDPLVRKSIADATGDEARFLAHLAKHGESSLDDLEVELGWDRKRLKSVRDRLQRSGAVIGHGLVFEDDSSWYFAPVRRWDQVFPEPAAVGRPFHELILAAMRAAVLAPEGDLARWFSWPTPRGVVEELVAEGRLIRPAPSWLAIAE
ncbi:MAG TPA: hypothetical protein VGX22_00105 [Candidatus Dormibacteraeota bacterium]|nr:hypothetical protein [Candidatus Dormibacteraeota bacterium]